SCYPGTDAQQGSGAGVGTMADDPYARIAELEAEVGELRRTHTAELELRDRALAEALEQQTSTAEILRAIASSPADRRSALDAIAESAARLCGADRSAIQAVEGRSQRFVAFYGGDLPYPIGTLVPLSRGTNTGRAILDRTIVHTPDVG